LFLSKSPFHFSLGVLDPVDVFYHRQKHRGGWGELRAIPEGSKVPPVEGYLKAVRLERDA
jgi:hypothetical protein